MGTAELDAGVRIGRRVAQRRLPIEVAAQDGGEEHEVQPAAVDRPIALDRAEHHVDGRADAGGREVDLGGRADRRQFPRIAQALREGDEAVMRQRHESLNVGPGEDIRMHDYAARDASAQFRADQGLHVASYGLE